jgi:hypothetical protein
LTVRVLPPRGSGAQSLSRSWAGEVPAAATTYPGPLVAPSQGTFTPEWGPFADRARPRRRGAPAATQDAGDGRDVPPPRTGRDGCRPGVARIKAIMAAISVDRVSHKDVALRQT